jgi:hypothetical protein
LSGLDTLAERRMRSLLVADVRAFDPRIRIRDADLSIMSGWKQHDDRWMEWRFDDVKVEGYFRSAHGAHAAGWAEWLRRIMTDAEHAAYQTGDASGWKRRDRRPPTDIQGRND